MDGCLVGKFVVLVQTKEFCVKLGYGKIITGSYCFTKVKVRFLVPITGSQK